MSLHQKNEPILMHYALIYRIQAPVLYFCFIAMGK